MKFRHKNRGSEYILFDIIECAEDLEEGDDFVYREDGEICYAKMQVSCPKSAGSLVCLYYSADDGVIWGRPANEFFDGRFERV